jgi:hypothetical protein
VGQRREIASSHDRPSAEAAPDGESRPRTAERDPTPAPGSTLLWTWATDPATPRAASERSSGGDLPPGTPVGPYVLDAWLARGGFGDVYRATHATLGAARAVKVLHADLAATRPAILRFEREVEAIQRVSHPNVIAIESFGQLPDGRPWFAMELLAGADLGARLASGGRLSPRDALAVLEPLCAALDAVHARGIVHRDLKPSNVFLDEPDGRRRVILLDFGVAKLLDDSGPGLTGSLQLIGTPAFMAPEQIRGQSAGTRTDVYALGALEHAMLTGEAPFSESPDALGQLQLHLHTRPPRVSSRAPVDPAFDEVVSRAMSKHPDKRHASAGALLEDFRRAVGALEPAPAPPMGALSRRGAAVYVGVRADDASLDEPDDRILADLDAILPRAAAILARRGLRPALELGNAALFVMELPGCGDGGGGVGGDGGAVEVERVARAELLEAARSMHAELAERPGRDERIEVSVWLHAGPVVLDERGAWSGPLLDVAAWVPEVAAAGVHASEAMLA